MATGSVIEGFSFNDYCLRCQKVTEHKIELNDDDLFDTCASCAKTRLLKDVNQAYYPKTELWVTRFKVDNLPCVVAGKLLDASRRIGNNRKYLVALQFSSYST